MTEHILNFAVEFDDEKIRDMVEKKAVDSIVADIKQQLLDAIFDNGYYGHSAVIRKKDSCTGKETVEVSKNAKLKSWVIEVIKEDLNEHRNEIIQLAAKELAESFKRTKKWKEKTEGAL